MKNFDINKIITLEDVLFKKKKNLYLNLGFIIEFVRDNG